MEIIVRKAKQRDLPYIYNLVKELAVYEEAGNQVTASLEDYQSDFEENVFESLVAVIDSDIVGMMIYYMTYSTWKGKMLYLEDFIVQDNYRNQGVGQQLYNAFIAVARDKQARLAKWQVLDWNDPAINFYEKNNAIIEKNWWNVKIFLDI